MDKTPKHKVKLIEGNLRKYFKTLECIGIFWRRHQNTGNKSKNRQMELYQAKKFTAKETINRRKRM
jgi:hypothetical protein